MGSRQLLHLINARGHVAVGVVEGLLQAGDLVTHRQPRQWKIARRNIHTTTVSSNG
jgi:hypothetical protein